MQAYPGTRRYPGLIDQRETRIQMPKMKTHRGAVARFKVTGSGKLMHRHPMRSHLLAKKNSKRTRRLALESEVSAGDRREAKRLLGM